jgi:hypothetical protein
MQIYKTLTSSLTHKQCQNEGWQPKTQEWGILIVMEYEVESHWWPKIASKAPMSAMKKSRRIFICTKRTWDIVWSRATFSSPNPQSKSWLWGSCDCRENSTKRWLAKCCICSNQTKTNLRMVVVITLQVSFTKYQNITYTYDLGITLAMLKAWGPLTTKNTQWCWGFLV